MGLHRVQYESNLEELHEILIKIPRGPMNLSVVQINNQESQEILLKILTNGTDLHRMIVAKISVPSPVFS